MIYCTQRIMITQTLFLEIAAVLVLAGGLSCVAFFFRQPLVIAYLLTGIAVSTKFLGVLHSTEVFSTLSSMGVAFLLFIVGLGLNWRNVRDVGTAAALAGLGQTLVTSALGCGLALLMRFDLWTSVFIGVSFSFSSTILIVKMLSDKEDINRLYGRIAVGALIVQDIVAMFALLFISGYRVGGDLSVLVGTVVTKGVIALCVLWFLARFFVPKIFRYAARSSELLFLLGLGWCFAVASVLYMLGFGVEIGALLAGVSLAGSGFQHEIEAKIRVLRDFFLVIFFIVLGTHLGFGDIGHLLLPALIFSLFVVVGNPLIMLVVMRTMGHHPRTGFLAGTTVAQISEFSFILLGAGIAAGLVRADTLTLATIVGMVTIAISSYLISYNEEIFERLSRRIPWLNGQGMLLNDALAENAPDIVLLGCDRLGQEVLPEIQRVTKHYCIVDVNPVLVEQLAAKGISVVYGDAGNEDVLRQAGAFRARMVISTIPDMQISIDVIDVLKNAGSRATIVVTAKSPDDAVQCYGLGAAFVIVPSILGGIHFAQMLKKNKFRKAAWKSHRGAV